jgi:hypothetical protein
MYLYEHSKTITSVVGRNYSRSSSEAKFVAYTTARASKWLRACPLSPYVYIACADSIPELYIRVERLKVQESSWHNHNELYEGSK